MTYHKKILLAVRLDMLNAIDERAKEQMMNRSEYLRDLVRRDVGANTKQAESARLLQELRSNAANILSDGSYNTGVVNTPFNSDSGRGVVRR